MDEASPKISVEYFDNATVVFLSEENILRERDITAIESSVMPLIEKTDGVNLIINFRNVKFLTSSALGLLIRISKKAYENNGKMLLCTISPKIYQIFEITRLDKVFSIYDTQAQALESVE
ncbi:MAG: STAS domain-containing protein [Planctomycetes bacterium]|nr:STAS domain-containing protein [Planctomycetota bacterium]